MNSKEDIWIFHGEGGRFTSGVFESLELAESWISKHNLTGILSLYPVNFGVYDWAITNDYFEVKSEKHKSSAFIQNFSSASQEHYHYENGHKE